MLTECLLNLDCNLVESMKRKTQVKNSFVLRGKKLVAQASLQQLTMVNTVSYSLSEYQVNFLQKNEALLTDISAI